MTIVDMCRAVSEAESPKISETGTATEEQVQALIDARERLFDYVDARMKSAESGTVDACFANDMAYFNTWYLLRFRKKPQP